MAKKTTKKETEVKKKATKKTQEKASAPKAAKSKKTTASKSASTTKRTTRSRAAREVEVITASRKKKKIKGYSKEDLVEFKALIVSKRDEILETLHNLKEQMMDTSTGQYVNENSPYSLHMAEQGTDAMEREKLYLWAQRENKFLGYLEDALARIETGTYGICVECIDEPQHLCPTCPLIPKDRLMAVPHTQHCLQVKQKMQNKK